MAGTARAQDVAARKLAHARKQIEGTMRRIKRAATSLRLWERRAAHYAKLASLTDAEVAARRDADRQRREDRAARRLRRGIRLEKEGA